MNASQRLGKRRDNRTIRQDKNQARIPTLPAMSSPILSEKNPERNPPIVAPTPKQIVEVPVILLRISEGVSTGIR